MDAYNDQIVEKMSGARLKNSKQQILSNWDDLINFMSGNYLYYEEYDLLMRIKERVLLNANKYTTNNILTGLHLRLGIPNKCPQYRSLWQEKILISKKQVRDDYLIAKSKAASDGDAHVDTTGKMSVP